MTLQHPPTPDDLLRCDCCHTVIQQGTRCKECTRSDITPEVRAAWEDECDRLRENAAEIEGDLEEELQREREIRAEREAAQYE